MEEQMAAESATLNDLEKRAALMLARGYSRITTAHVLGMRESVLDNWLRDPRFRSEVDSNQKSRHYVRVGISA